MFQVTDLICRHPLFSKCQKVCCIYATVSCDFDSLLVQFYGVTIHSKKYVLFNVYKHILIFNIVLEMDLIPMAVTFIACLGIGLDYGMLMGIGINLIFILYSSARPKVRVRSLTVSSLLLVKYIYGCRFVRFSGTTDYNE